MRCALKCDNDKLCMTPESAKLWIDICNFCGKCYMFLHASRDLGTEVCAFINNSESQEAHSKRILQVETCRGLACHSGIFVNFVSDIAMHEFGPVSIIHICMDDCPCASML